METIDVCIGTYGSDFEYWGPLINRAIASAENQTHTCGVISVHNPSSSLSQVRNEAARHSGADWLIFLDADDELDKNYASVMLEGDTDIRQPSSLGVYADGSTDDYPVLIPPVPGGFLVGNHLVIGSMVRHEIFDQVGGFRELPILEDWDLWIRCQLVGATVGTCPNAIYRVHVNQGSRNMQNNHGQVYSEIQGRYQAAWSNRQSLS